MYRTAARRLGSRSFAGFADQIIDQVDRQRARRASGKKPPASTNIDNMVRPCSSLADFERLADQACGLLGLSAEDAVEMSHKLPMGSPIDAVLVAA